MISRGQTADDRYSNALRSNINPWAPFTSEIDWKVTRWAKLRGPGSTAFSELLAIVGVHVQYLVFMMLANGILKVLGPQSIEPIVQELR